MPLGGIVTILVLLPNLLFVFFPPGGIPQAVVKKPPLFWIIEVLERLGQLSSFLTPFFYPLKIRDNQALIGLVVMVSAIGFYYACWLRYFIFKERTYNLLFMPLLGIPLPLALSPVVYFLAAAAFFHSWILFAAAVVLAAGHIPVSYIEWRRTEE
jgi:hypothetical protein